MAVFEYRGILVTSGKPTKGFRDAENAKSLRSTLRKDGILLTVATETKAKAAQDGKKKKLFSFGARASAADIAVMTRQLATLIGAGIPLFESLTALVDQVEQEPFARPSARSARRSARARASRRPSRRTPASSRTSTSTWSARGRPPARSKRCWSD